MDLSSFYSHSQPGDYQVYVTIAYVLGWGILCGLSATIYGAYFLMKRKLDMMDIGDES